MFNPEFKPETDVSQAPPSSKSAEQVVVLQSPAGSPTFPTSDSSDDSPDTSDTEAFNHKTKLYDSSRDTADHRHEQSGSSSSPDHGQYASLGSANFASLPVDLDLDPSEPTKDKIRSSDFVWVPDETDPTEATGPHATRSNNSGDSTRAHESDQSPSRCVSNSSSEESLHDNNVAAEPDTLLIPLHPIETTEPHARSWRVTQFCQPLAESWEYRYFVSTLNTLDINTFDLKTVAEIDSSLPSSSSRYKQIRNAFLKEFIDTATTNLISFNAIASLASLFLVENKGWPPLTQGINLKGFITYQGALIMPVQVVSLLQLFLQLESNLSRTRHATHPVVRTLADLNAFLYKLVSPLTSLLSTASFLHPTADATLTVHARLQGNTGPIYSSNASEYAVTGTCVLVGTLVGASQRYTGYRQERELPSFLTAVRQYSAYNTHTNFKELLKTIPTLLYPFFSAFATFGNLVFDILQLTIGTESLGSYLLLIGLSTVFGILGVLANLEPPASSHYLAKTYIAIQASTSLALVADPYIKNVLLGNNATPVIDASNRRLENLIVWGGSLLLPVVVCMVNHLVSLITWACTCERNNASDIERPAPMIAGQSAQFPKKALRYISERVDYDSGSHPSERLSLSDKLQQTAKYHSIN